MSMAISRLFAANSIDVKFKRAGFPNRACHSLKKKRNNDEEQQTHYAKAKIKCAHCYVDGTLGKKAFRQVTAK